MPTIRELRAPLKAEPVTSCRLHKTRMIFQIFIALAVIVSLGVVQVDAQSRRKKRTRRTATPVKRPVITNPTIALPGSETSTSDPKIISTADQTTPDETTTETQSKKPAKSTASDSDNMQQTITTLTNQVNRLNDRLTSMQEDDRYLLDMERLTRAEQRAESLRAQLIDVQSKMADLQAKLEQVEYMLKPENIDKATQLYGSTRPEEAREVRRKQLENEKGRLTAQLGILETSRIRLESAISTADSEVDLLRARLNQQRMEGDAKKMDAPKAASPNRRPE